MRLLLFLLVSFVTLKPHVASADEFFVDRLALKGALKPVLESEKQKKLERILQTETRKLLPEALTASKTKAATVIKPTLSASKSGVRLVLQRYDLGDLFSTIEVAEFENVPEAEWNRTCARAVRDLIYGNFRQPTPEPDSRFASR